MACRWSYVKPEGVCQISVFLKEERLGTQNLHPKKKSSVVEA